MRGEREREKTQEAKKRQEYVINKWMNAKFYKDIKPRPAMLKNMT